MVKLFFFYYGHFCTTFILVFCLKLILGNVIFKMLVAVLYLNHSVCFMQQSHFFVLLSLLKDSFEIKVDGE